MSTVQSYQYRVDPEELRHRQLIAVESRKLDIAHLQAQQQMNQLCNQMKAISEEMKILSLLDKRSDSNKNYLKERNSSPGISPYISKC